MLFVNIMLFVVILLTQAFQRAEAHGFGFAGLEYREVGRRYVYPFRQFAQRYLALGHHHIKVNYNHSVTPNS